MADRMMWLVNGALVTPHGVTTGAVKVTDGRIAAICATAPAQARRLNVHGRYISPGFIDLHIWGEPQRVAREAVRSGTTRFLTTIGPEPPERLVSAVVACGDRPAVRGAQCLGVHLEGPFLNPRKGGALASRWLRPAARRELTQLFASAGGHLKLLTLAPELPESLHAIRWAARHGIVASLGHTDANTAVAHRAVQAGARSVTHTFNGMRPLHHRDPGLLGEALTNPRLTCMVILDGVHVDPVAFQVLWRCKGSEGVVLVTDSIQHQAERPRLRGGAFYLSNGTLAGSCLTMAQAVRNATVFGPVPLPEAVQMASLNPARLLGLEKELGSLEVGKRADLVVFDETFTVHLTMVDGATVFHD